MSYKQWDINICECGRIHFLDYSNLYELCKKNQSVILFCSNCGNATLMWLEPSLDGETFCSRRIYNDELIKVDKYNLNGIFISKGIKVPMTSGNPSNCFIGSNFMDSNSKKKEEVDTLKLINSIKDNRKLEELSTLGVNIHWKGTKYEKPYNK